MKVIVVVLLFFDVSLSLIYMDVIVVIVSSLKYLQWLSFLEPQM